LLLALAIAPGSVGAEQPYVTDDTGTQGRGNWQLELTGKYIHHDRTAEVGGARIDQERKVSVVGPVLTYGVTDNIDAAIGAAYLRDRITENGVTVQDSEGAGDTIVEIKWRFYEQNGLSLAVRPGVGLPTGDEDKGLGTGAVSWGVNGILTYESGAWTWLANLAYTQAHFKSSQDADANRQHLWRLSGGLGYRLNEKLKLAAEAGIRTNPARDDPFLTGHNGHFVTLGVIYSPAEKIDLALGLRRSTNSDESDWMIPLGLTVRW
jgi:hypothetical protein